ncbi:hypothetical protein Ga0100231_024210 [Opitutaceae bacterium TAV4]|nr:hypothetical protein Ga0100231_024210 [Opitutaceae bacterium TAV4]RRK00815.1 hypothetical protein Ga0100230_023785 [Opitutaceae bacterium TAV3]
MSLRDDPLDWVALDRLRAGFLSGQAAGRGPYWESERDLESYDATYGERIGWKWDAVLAELRERGWRPPAGAVLLDWGCGSGVAGRRVAGAFGAGCFVAARVWDHSALARRFALDRLRREFPGIGDVGEWTGPAGGGGGGGGDAPLVLVVSHVINELSADDRSRLIALAAGAAAVLWVEPGTHADSRALAAVRDELLAAPPTATAANGAWRIVAPCTHREGCPLFQEANERHWCHFFAPPPRGVQNDSGWVRFGQRAGIDLRSLPYSFLVMERVSGGMAGTVAAAGMANGIDEQNRGATRVLGRPEVFKGYARMLGCDGAGLTELELQKRTDPAFFKELERRPGIPLFRWRHDGRRIAEVERVVRSGEQGGEV